MREVSLLPTFLRYRTLETKSCFATTANKMEIPGKPMLGRQQTYDPSAEHVPPPVSVPKYTRQKTENYHASYATENEGVYTIDWCEARMHYAARNHVQFSLRRLLHLLPWRWCEWRQKVITQASKPKQPRHQSRNVVSTQIITKAQSQVNTSFHLVGGACHTHLRQYFGVWGCIFASYSMMFIYLVIHPHAWHGTKRRGTYWFITKTCAQLRSPQWHHCTEQGEQSLSRARCFLNNSFQGFLVCLTVYSFLFGLKVSDQIRSSFQQWRLFYISLTISVFLLLIASSGESAASHRAGSSL